MEVKRLSISIVLILIMATSLSFAKVTVSMKNIDTTAKTVEFHMSNVAGCNYCDDADYNAEASCKAFGEKSDGTAAEWNFDASKTQSDCTTANGIYFDGTVKGFQFILSGITIDTTTSNNYNEGGDLGLGLNGIEGTAKDGQFYVTAETKGSGKTALVGVSLTSAVIPASSAEVLLCKLPYTTIEGYACMQVQTGCPNSAQTADADKTCFEDLDSPNGDDVITAGDNNPVFSDPAGLNVNFTVTEGACGLGIEISKINSFSPKDFSISQNYPNPFNPITTINFEVAKSEDISLIIYDITGKEVAVLASGFYMPGNYMVEWNADDLSSGMYIYRYITSQKSITKKMLYLK